MEKQQGKTKSILKYRAYKFSLGIIDLLALLPKSYIFEIIGKQLLRCATLIGANIIEAQAGRTKKILPIFIRLPSKAPMKQNIGYLY